MIISIKNIMRSWSDRSQFGSLVFQFTRSIFSRVMLIFDDETYAKWFYKKYTNGKLLNLESPVLFDDKIWWLKLNNRDPLLTVCSDKNAVRDYIRQKGLEDILIPQIALYKNAKDIDFSSFSNEVILKCTSGSSENFIYDSRKKNNRNLIIKKFEFALRQNPYWFSREWNYKNIVPQITVEKLIRDKNGNLPIDYKIMCFGGEPKLLFLDIGVIGKDNIYNHKYPRNIYDMEFNLLPVRETRPNYYGVVKRPKNWGKMIEIAKILSKPFPFCRVDLYNVDGKIYFGEITFYHGSGCNDIKPAEWDHKIAAWIDLNSPKIRKRQF